MEPNPLPAEFTYELGCGFVMTESPTATGTSNAYNPPTDSLRLALNKPELKLLSADNRVNLADQSMYNNQPQPQQQYQNQVLLQDYYDQVRILENGLVMAESPTATSTSNAYNPPTDSLRLALNKPELKQLSADKRVNHASQSMYNNQPQPQYQNQVLHQDYYEQVRILENRLVMTESPSATVTSNVYNPPTDSLRLALNKPEIKQLSADKRVNLAGQSMYNNQPQPQHQFQNQVLHQDYYEQVRILQNRLAAHQQELNNLNTVNEEAIIRLSQISQGLQQQMQFDNNVLPSTSGNKFCEEIYQKLRAMFPDINREYIKTFCPADWAPGLSHDVQFGSIVERILENEAFWVMDANSNNLMAEIAADDSIKLNIDDTYEYLTEIFPNADPHYLRSSAEKFKYENDVKTFVDDKLNSNDYPTREQYWAKIKVTEEQLRYTTNFDVEQFLTLFPDPFTHFEDETRKCVFSLIVLEFLKNEFSRVRVSTINRIYRSSKFNMSIAAKNLRLTTDFIIKSRCPREIPTGNIPLLQEMAFVRHHEAIRKNLEAVKQIEEEEFNSLKAAGGLWTCQCCYDDECMPSKCSTCDNAHIFCNSCVVKGTDSKLGDGEIHVPCFLNCGSEFSISTLQKVISQTKFSILLKKRQAAEVMAAGLEGLVSCPFCLFASIPPEGDKIFKCLNPECMKESCIRCKEPNHVPFTCEEEKKSKARKYIEEKMTQALTRTCYQCKRVFFKEEGCNKMTCPCGAMMCYICNNPVKDYKHFRGEGSDKVDLCPLWSDNKRLNAENVRKVEEDARREILRQDPTLDIGTTGLAPALPPSAAGPHRNIPETQNMPNILAARELNEGRFDFQEQINRNRDINRHINRNINRHINRNINRHINRNINHNIYRNINRNINRNIDRN